MPRQLFVKEIKGAYLRQQLQNGGKGEQYVFLNKINKILRCC